MKAIVLSALRFLSVLITCLWVVFVAGVAAQEKKAQDKKVNKEAREAVLRMADLVGQKDMVLLKQQAEAVAKSIESLDEVMNLLRARTKGGLGVGDTPGAILPDGMDVVHARIPDTAVGMNLHAPRLFPRSLHHLPQSFFRLRLLAFAHVKLAKIADLHGGRR